MKIHLVIIDPQDSFCRVVPAAEQQKNHTGELCVTGAWDDMTRLSEMVKRLGDKLDDIHVTMDSHHQIHVAHPIYWREANSGNSPSPFTIMEEEKGQIVGYQFGPKGKQKVGIYVTRKPSFMRRTLDYIVALRDGKRYPHCIWPPHCIIGTQGHTIVPQLFDVLYEWEQKNFGILDIVTKGSNLFVEHFSALRAEVPDPNDPYTQINTAFINTVMEADVILLSGEAGSHCLSNTVRDVANEFVSQNDAFIKKCVLLTDATSPVPGFEQYQTDFISEMTKRGMKTTTTVDYLA